MSEVQSAPPQELRPEEMDSVDRIKAMLAELEGQPADASRVAETTVGEVPVQEVVPAAESSVHLSEDAPRSLHDLIRPAPSMQTSLNPTTAEAVPEARGEPEAVSPETPAVIGTPEAPDAPAEVEIPAEPATVSVEVEADAPTAPVVPAPPEVNYDEPLRLAFVSQEHDAAVQVRHEVKQRQQEWAQEGGKVKKFVKGIWNTYLGEIHGLKYRREAREEIRQNGNVFIGQSKEEARRSLQATINRHTSNYEEMIHRDRGERREDLAEDSELAVKIKDFIRKNIDGELSDEALREEAVRAVNAYGEGIDRKAFNENAMIADNLIAIRDAVVGAREHEGGIERVLEDLKISVGESRTGANTEARYNWVEKVADKISSTRVGAIASPEAVLVAATVAGSILRVGGTRAAASVLTFVPGAAGAGLAALRESRTTEDERVQTMRDMTLGRRAEAGSKRREQLEKTVYTMAAASDMTAELYALIGEDIDLDDHENLRNAFNSIVNTRARIKSSETKGIDLISYSEGNMEEERAALDLARAYAKAAVRSKMDNQDTLRALGMPVGMDFDALIERQADLSTEFDKDIDAKDRAFKKLKHKRVATAAAIGAVTGLVLGTAAQETYAMFDPTRAGLVEQLWHAKTELYNGQEHHTLLDGLVQGQSSHEINVHHAASHGFEASSFGSDDTKYDVSADHTLVHHDNGTFDLVSHGDDKPVTGLETNPDGTLTAGALDKLHDAGFKVTDHTETLTRDVTKTETSSIHQFIQHHRGDFTHATTDLWYDNNTPAPDFDQNELKLQWAGHDGLDGHGGYKMTIANMTENGSFHDAKEAKLHELIASGKMKIALSADVNTQHQVILVDVNKDGTIDMAKGSTAAELFSNENGHAEFNGGYAQAVQLEGKGSDGVQHMASLATVVGNNSLHEIHDTFTTRESYLHHTYSIKSEGFTTHERVGDYTEMAPVLPIVPRRGLERAVQLSLKNPELTSMYYSGTSIEEMRQWIEENPTLKKTRIKVETPASVEWIEQDSTPVERNVPRERQAIESYIDRLRASDGEHFQTVERIADSLAPMDDECRVAINVPAWFEERNIAHLLDEFSRQTDAEGKKLNPRLFEINILVNRKSGTPADKSVERIKQFIASHTGSAEAPKINYYDIELDPPLNNVGNARKLITDATVLRSLRRNNQQQPLYIESEDADVLHADPKMVYNLFSKFDEKPYLDALRGIQDRDPEFLKDNDYLFLRRRVEDFYELLARQKRFRNPNDPHWHWMWNRKAITGGWNTGYTAEAYADIDGYDKYQAVGEDLRIGEKIGMIRGDGTTPNLETIGTVSSRSDSSPRRFIQEIIAGQEAYDDFTNEAANKAIREQSVPQLMSLIESHARINDGNRSDFDGVARGIYRRMKSVSLDNKKDAEEMTRRALFMLGFGKDDYTIEENGDVTVKDWTGFSSATENYRRRWNARRSASPSRA